MPLFAANPPPQDAFWISAIFGLFLFGTFYVWVQLCKRFWTRKPIPPAYEPRRFVPWKGVDLLVILAFFLLMGFSFQLGILFLENARTRPAVERKDNRQTVERKSEKKTTEHPLAQLLKDKQLFAVALAFAIGVVIAPISEELFFRVLLIGWLESSEKRWRRQLRSLLGRMRRGFLPILLSSLLFASLHNRPESSESDQTNLILTLGLSALTSILAVAFSLVWIRSQTSATARDFGWDTEHFWEDVRTGAAAFLAIAIPIIALQYVLINYVLPEQVVADSIPLFFFAIVLGFLYYRTHRIVPSITLHMLLNASSFASIWLS